MITFADRLRGLRGERDMRQSELAAQLNTTTSSVSYWESGQGAPHIDIILRLADFFGVSLDYLMGKTDYRHLDIPMERLCESLAVLMHGEVQKLPPEIQIEIAKYIKYQIWKEGTGKTPS